MLGVTLRFFEILVKLKYGLFWQSEILRGEKSCSIMIRINLWNHLQRETLWCSSKTLKWITVQQEPGLCSTHWVKSCLLYLQATCSNQMKAGAHMHAVGRCIISNSDQLFVCRLTGSWWFPTGLVFQVNYSFSIKDYCQFHTLVILWLTEEVSRCSKSIGSGGHLLLYLFFLSVHWTQIFSYEKLCGSVFGRKSKNIPGCHKTL